MWWLEDMEYDWEYQCNSCGFTTERKTTVANKPKENPICDACGKDTTAAGFKPNKVNQASRISFEKNGRIGYRITTGTGESSCISKTKYEYMKTFKNKSHFAKDYVEHLKDQQTDEFGQFKKQLNSKGTVTGATQTMIKKEISNDESTAKKE